MSDDAKSAPTTAAEAASPSPAPATEIKEAVAVPSTESKPAAPEPAAVPVAEAPAAATPAPEPTPTKPTEPAAEPQNPLTKKFTDKEWSSLKEFRSQLPDIFAEAFPDKPDARTTPITLWNVTVHPDKFEDARVSVILMKFLRARNLNVAAARDMFVETLRWRDAFKPEETLKESFPEDVFGKLGYVYGKDKQGRPVTYNVYGGNKDLQAVFGDVQRFLRWRVSLMEKGIALLDFENTDQMIQVHDYDGVKMSDRDQNSKNAASEATSVFSGHYPEFLYRKFFVNVSSLLTWIFWLFKPLIPSQTFAKMSVVGSGPKTIGKELLPYIDAEQLPERYGGKAKAW